MLPLSVQPSLVLSDLLRPVDRSSLDSLLTSGEAVRATGLTQQVLTFAKGGQPVKRISAIGHLLPEWASFVLRGSNVLCDWSLPPDLWAVDIDEGQMSQVVHNLILNAQQAMPNGGTITVRCENLTLPGPASLQPLPLPDGRYVKITAQDRGAASRRSYCPGYSIPTSRRRKQGAAWACPPPSRLSIITEGV